MLIWKINQIRKRSLVKLMNNNIVPKSYSYKTIKFKKLDTGIKNWGRRGNLNG